MVKTKINSFDINNEYIINVKSFDKLIEVFGFIGANALEDNDPRFVETDEKTKLKTLNKSFWNKIKISLIKKKNFNFVWTGNTSFYNYKLNKIKNLNKIFVSEESIKMILDSNNKEWRVATLLKLANIFASSKKYNLDNDVKIILLTNVFQNWNIIKYKEIKFSLNFYENCIKSVHTDRISDFIEKLLITPTGALHPVREKNSYEGKSFVEVKINKFLLNCYIYTHYAYKREYTFLVNVMDPNAGPVMENNSFRQFPTKEVTYTRYVMYVPPLEGFNLKINKVGKRFNLEKGIIEDVYEAQDSLTYLVNNTFKKVEGFHPLGSKTPVEPTDKEKDLARLAGVEPEAAEEAIWLLNNGYYDSLLPAEVSIEIASTYGYTAIVEAIKKSVEEGKILQHEEDYVLFGNEIYFEDEAADSSEIEEDE